MIVLDSSLVIAWLSPADAHHEQAIELFVTRLDHVMLIHTLTLAEVLVGPSRTGQAEAVRRDLTRVGIRVAERDAEEPVRLASLRAATRLRLSDCCVLDTAQTTGRPLVTFDTRMRVVARRLGVEVLPAA